MTELAIDSAVYFGVIYARDYLATKMNWRVVYGQMERLWKTGIFAAASWGWDQLPESFYDAFIEAGKKIEMPDLGLCAYCQARNIYIVFIQFLVGWFRHGMMGASGSLWMALDEFVRLSGTDLISSNWVRPMLMGNSGILRNNLSMVRNAQLMPGQVRVGSNTTSSDMYIN